MLSFLLLFLISLPLKMAYSLEIDRPPDSIVDPMGSYHFEVDHSLRKNVDFWIRIYSHYSSREGVIHDAKYIDHVYEYVDYAHIKGSPSVYVSHLKRKWRAVLYSVQHKQNHPETLNAQEKYVFNLFKDVNEPNKFLNAAHRRRLRFQLGQKDRFLDGLKQSGKYLSKMEEIFKREGVPIELTRLPFVESSFNLKAHSKVGATGIWQFIHSTAKIFLNINPTIDERDDPIRATEAAAQLLRLNYNSLKSWPLAVTAYNHGRKAMMRAVRKVGSEQLSDLMRAYHYRSFGFASSNFYSEFLAALYVEKNAEKYFGKILRDAPLQYFEVEIPERVNFQKLIQNLPFDRKILRELNPALSEQAYQGYLQLPAHSTLRLPLENGKSIEANKKDFWGKLKLKAQPL